MPTCSRCLCAHAQCCQVHMVVAGDSSESAQVLLLGHRRIRRKHVVRAWRGACKLNVGSRDGRSTHRQLSAPLGRNNIQPHHNMDMMETPGLLCVDCAHQFCNFVCHANAACSVN